MLLAMCAGLKHQLGKLLWGWRRIMGQWWGLCVATHVFLTISHSSLLPQLCPKTSEDLGQVSRAVLSLLVELWTRFPGAG